MHIGASVQSKNRRGLVVSAAFSLVLFLASGTAARAQESPHGDLSVACEDCHNPSSWKDVSGSLKFDHGRTKFPLSGQHTQVACRTCHKDLKFAVAPVLCADCHTDVHHDELGNACDRCHSPRSWLVPDMARRHTGTRFPLMGPHQSLPCQSCHVNQQKQEYVNVPVDCVGCHRSTYDATTSPSHRAAGFGTDCQQCHSITSMTWGGKFNHDMTGFSLTGAHTAIQCAACHAGNRFAGTPTSCVDCHINNFNTAVNPKHVTGVFSTDCLTCHSMAGWRPATFDHNKTPFPLTGAHAARQCVDCHVNSQLASTPTQCYACHQSSYASANAPKHSPGLTTDCTGCHNTTAWQPSVFIHSSTGFALTGAHLSVQCGSCHGNGVFANTATACVGCHLSNFNTATNPVHTPPAFSQDCVSCHSTAGWQPASFDHNKTQFPLTGAHAARQCTDCHKNSQFTGTSVQCYSCHQASYASANAPQHSPGLPTNCAVCHNTTTWQPSVFNHSMTGFGLVGAHVNTLCARCHASGVYANAPTTCVGCHLKDFNTTTAPAHAPAAFPTDCTLCHTPVAWQPSSFDHNKTVFPLTGAHVAVKCIDCHAGNVFAGTSTACFTCHSGAYTSVVNPRHVPSVFSTDCTKCHTTAAWNPASFDHNKTQFPLTGAHAARQCTDCHKNSQFTGTPVQCYACHQSDYSNPATKPVHTIGLSTDCLGCHNTTAWVPSTFNHTSTGFALTGAHVTTACNSCHKTAYAGTTTLCYGCHQANYNGTNNPVHSSAGFPTTCETCHSTTSWANATFNHSWFPQTHGNSGGVCLACHPNSADYSVFTCTSSGCHPKARTDQQHAGRANYVYNSVNCYSCHPTGGGGG